MGKAPVRESPIKGKPLRLPGQSTEDRLRRLLEEDLMAWVLAAAFVVSLAVFEWLRWASDIKPSPVAASVIALLFIGYAAFRIAKKLPEVKALKQGREGEVVVGQYLDLLQEKGHRVFHDLVADNFNVDHVIIGTKGIYVAETKTYGKRPGKNDRVRFQNGELRVDGITLDRDPVAQVEAAAKWVAGVVRESTGKEFPVRPVLLFPGWWVEADSQKNVWVLEPKALPKFLERQADRMSAEDAKLVTFHLSRFIRTS